MKTDERDESILLVDNSNTRTKFMRACAGELLPEQRVLPTAELTAGEVHKLLGGWTYGRVVGCSVVPAARQAIEEGVNMPVAWLGADSPMNIQLDYPQPDTLGADRIANAMAAAHHCPLPCVAVDFGTAATYDVVLPSESQARFIGGVIAPGLAALGQYLERHAALLPVVEPQAPQHAIGRSTQEALLSGAYHGYRGMVREILHSLADELGQQPYVIATGGDAALLAAQLPEIDEVDSQLTFRGLLLASTMGR